jgi:hypothetical protein
MSITEALAVETSAVANARISRICIFPKNEMNTINLTRKRGRMQILNLQALEETRKRRLSTEDKRYYSSRT